MGNYLLLVSVAAPFTNPFISVIGIKTSSDCSVCAVTMPEIFSTVISSPYVFLYFSTSLEDNTFFNNRDFVSQSKTVIFFLVERS